MDDIVKAALQEVAQRARTAMAGWRLTRAATGTCATTACKHAGPFPQVKGSRILHDKLREFIHRNYAADEAGCWFFQNGPQRVYVELEAAPWVWRLSTHAGRTLIHSHSDIAATFASAWLDEHGRLFLATELGLGLVHTLDMGLAADAVERGEWAPVEARFDTLPGRFGYCLSPAATQAVVPHA